MASDYCYSKEMVRAIERHERNEARVIPVILRPVYGWQKAPFGKLQALPTGAQPVTIRQNRDEAFRNVAEGIHKAIEELTSSPSIDLNRLPPSPHGPYRPTDKLPKHCSRRVLIILVALSLVIIGVFGVVSWEIQLHQLEPPTGFTVARTTLQSGQIMQRGQALVNADIPLTIQGTYTSEGLGLVWVVLRDNFGNYYLQNPPVQFNGGGTWTATNITPRSGTTSIDFVAVTPDGNGTFQQKVSNGDFGAFTQLPQGSLILSSATIPINTSQIRS